MFLHVCSMCVWMVYDVETEVAERMINPNFNPHINADGNDFNWYCISWIWIEWNEPKRVKNMALAMTMAIWAPWLLVIVFKQNRIKC